MNLEVNTNNVIIQQLDQVESGEYNVTRCNFTFTNEYESLTKKAVFTGEDGTAYLQTIVDNQCSIPSEILSTSQVVQIGVYAYAVENEELILRYSPEPTQFYIHQGSYKEAQNSTPPTPSEIEQLQSQITQNANDIDTLETNIGNIQSDITDIQAEQTEQNRNIQNNANNITMLQNTKADKSEIPTKTSELINDSDYVSDANYVHTDNNFTNKDKEQITDNKDDIVQINQDIQDLGTNKADKTEIPTKTSDLTNDSGFINKNVNDLTNYTLKINTGSLIDLEINGTTYVITLSLKNQDGTVISTDTIDLPLESVVVSGSYDAVNKKIVLTLENGNTVDIPVGDLIAGLQTEITSQNKLASDLVDDSNSGNKFVITSEKQAWNAKYDKPVGGIPKTDLASDVQTSLGKADTAIQDISGKQDLLTAGANIQISNNVVSATDTTYSNATDETAGLMSATDKSKLDGIEAQANKTIVDNTLNSTSENPVQNKVIYASQEVQNTKIEALEADVEDLRNASMKVQGSGTNFKLSNTAKAKFLELLMGGNTEQEGTPSSDNEVPIKNATGNVRNYVTSKNYQISEWEVGSISGGNGTNQSSTTRLRTKDFIEIPNKTLKCFIVGNISHVNIFEYNLSNGFIQSSGWKNNDYEFTPSENTKYIRILCQNNGNTITLDDVKLSFVYENMQNLPLTLGNTEICKIGDYKDYFYKENGKWYLHKEIGKVVLDGSEEWEYAEQYNYFRVSSYNFTDIPLDTSLQLSNYFICIGVWSTFRDNTNLNGFFKLQNIGYKLAFRNTNFDNVTDFKNWLATHNTKVYYPLETPTNTEVTDTTLISQLEATLQAYTYADETNISSTSDGVGMIIDAIAIRNMNDIISRLEALESEV